MTPSMYQLLSDVVLTLHLTIVAFVVGGLTVIVGGNLRGWRWVNLFWFRALHLAAIAYIAVEAWTGIVCPLTTLEMRLRSKAHQSAYAGGFVEHWMQRLLYYDAPPWVFLAGYTAFGFAIAATWYAWPPLGARLKRGAGTALRSGS
jgi:hypothetical protein